MIKHGEGADWRLWEASGWNFLGAAYHLIGDTRAAREHIEHGIRIMHENEITLNLCHFYNFLSLVHCDSGNFKSAYESAQKSLELSKTYNEKWIRGFSGISLGRVLARMDSSPSGEAEESILKGMTICEDLEVRPLLYQGCLFLGELYADRGQNQEALENFTKAEAEFRNMGMHYWQGRTYSAFAEFYKKQGNQGKAMENLGKAIEIFKECGADGWADKYEKELASF